MYDLIIIGAGPAGLSAAYAARSAGLTYLVLERDCIVHTIYQFPTGLTFYSTPELISLGNVPMIVQSQKPTREEALNYYLKFVETQQLKVHTYEEVRSVTGRDGNFAIRSISQTTGDQTYQARKVIIATGAFDQTNKLNIPGEDLPKVQHYFKEAHPFFDRDVLVIGGKSSAVETALSLYRSGARVTISYRRHSFTGIKYWVLPDLENRIKEASITAFMNSTVKEIRSAEVILHTDGQDRAIPNDFVFCMIGHDPDTAFLNSVGVQIKAENRSPIFNPETFETNVPGIYAIGVITAGNVSSETFIENSRLHGPKVIAHIQSLTD